EAIRSGNYRYKIPTRFNPYLKPGDVDITSNLNFSYLHLTGKRSGLETVFFGPQNCLAVPEQRIGNIDLSTSEGYAREKVNNYEIFIKGKEGSPVDFDMLIQSSINIPEDMRYRNPFSEIWGIERIALEPQEMLQVSPDEKILGSDNLKRDLKKVGVSNVDEFCSELKEWGKGRDELTSRLFSKFRTDSRGKKVLEVLEKRGLLKKGVSIEEERAMPPTGETGERETEEMARLPKTPKEFLNDEEKKAIRAMGDAAHERRFVDPESLSREIIETLLEKGLIEPVGKKYGLTEKGVIAYDTQIEYLERSQRAMGPELLEKPEKEKPGAIRGDRLTWVNIHNEIGGDAIKIINALRALERKGLIEGRETGRNREYVPKKDIEKLREGVELDEFEERVLSSIIRWRMEEKKPAAYFDGGMEMLKEVITGEIHNPYRKTLKEIKKNVEGKGK
ncbi:MAG: hypothetical protein DRO62_01265, partial [Candidatus Altiarchaeales archaeon]